MTYMFILKCALKLVEEIKGSALTFNRLFRFSKDKEKLVWYFQFLKVQSLSGLHST